MSIPIVNSARIKKSESVKNRWVVGIDRWDRDGKINDDKKHQLKDEIETKEGELEHGALWHVPGGYAMREALGGALAIVPSSKKVGGIGCRLDIPITHINASYVRSHFDAMEVYVQDAPKSKEIVYSLVMTTGGRTHSRVGGLEADQISFKDGLR